MAIVRRNGVSARLTIFQRISCTLAVSVLAACATRMDNAPVVERSGVPPGAALSTLQGSGPPPPGYYRVKPGDTLYRVALENGQNYRDIAAWNNLQNPNQIEVGQLLRVAPPGTTPVAGATPDVSTTPVTGGAVQAMPLTSAPATGTAPPEAPGNVAPGVGVTPGIPAAGAAQMAPATPITFSWPAHGPILNTFDEARNKGLNIGGKPGDPVRAAADGRVVYAGSGLRGYGNLVIIKHDPTFLTAYAHNRALLVKDGDAVTKGQKIAEMGSSDADRVMLHFEVRRQGKPVDPMKYLPPQ